MRARAEFAFFIN